MGAGGGTGKSLGAETDPTLLFPSGEAGKTGSVATTVFETASMTETSLLI
jgi:hypothetical protein